MKNAYTRANELFNAPGNSIPAPARAYAGHLCNEHGACTEVFITAYAHYAECCEGAEPSKDADYVADDAAKAFFHAYRAPHHSV